MKLSVSLIALGFTILLTAGCSSWVAKVLPFGQPVTKERCEALDVAEFGRKDGAEGRRSGERIEFWVGDCKPLGVKLDRAKYDAGYEEGTQFYCSCERGFEAGVKTEFTEFKGQYYLCSRSEFGAYLKGHAAGLDFSKDPRYVKLIPPFNYQYFEKEIAEKAAEMCSMLPANGSSGDLPAKLSDEVLSGPTVIK